MIGRRPTAGLLVDLAIVVLLSGCASSATSSPSPLTSTVQCQAELADLESEPSASPRALPPEYGLTWSRVPPGQALQASARPWPPGAIVAGPNSFVARDGGDLWVSTSGVGWSPVPNFSRYPLGVTSLGRGGLGFLALSGVLSLSDVWTSRDGQAWCLLSESLNGGFTDMVTVGATLVAVGASSSGPSLGQSAWFSEDARDWVEVSAGPGGEDWYIDLLVPGEPGVVALGRSTSMDSSSRWMAWLTVDGQQWSPGLILPDRDLRIEDAISWGSGFIAVGGFYKGSGFGDGAVWRSADGLHWTREQSDPVLPWLTHVVSGGDGLLAVGDASTPTGSCGQEVWTSADAVNWRRVATFCGQEVYGLDGNGQHLVAVGLDGESAAVWVSP